MFLHTGWERFAPAHNLEVSCLLNFKCEGDDELMVKVIGPTCCRKHYHGTSTDDSEDGEI
jgi:hypothetical protein